VAEDGQKRDPSSHRTPGQIKRMDRGYNSTPEMIRRRGMQNKARTIMAKDLGKAAIAGKDVDHRVMLDDGGGNGRKNLRIQSEKQNRGWRRNGPPNK
jgi:hypothetical protein